MGAAPEVFSYLYWVAEQGEMMQRRYDERQAIGLQQRSKEIEDRAGRAEILDIHLLELESLASCADVQLSMSSEKLTSVPHELHRYESES